MNERGHYGNGGAGVASREQLHASIGTNPREQRGWWEDWRTWAKIGAGAAAFGAAYYVIVRPMESQWKDFKRWEREDREAQHTSIAKTAPRRSHQQ